MAVFCVPVVFVSKVCVPKATLLFAVVLAFKALNPTATLPIPVVFANREL